VLANNPLVDRFVLGVSELYALRVLSWNDRLSALIADSRFMLALATCLETFQLKGKVFCRHLLESHLLAHPLFEGLFGHIRRP
jgi:hypothetical protein